MPFIAVGLILLSAAPEPPNVVFLTVDTLRADHLGCYGYGLPTSPNLDAWAKDGLLFENAVCEQPQTTPSFCAMLSSRYPRMTGVIRNAVALPDDVPIVPERFEAAGYQTAAVLSNWNLKRDLCGLGRGFDLYLDDFDDGAALRRIANAWRSAEDVTALAIEIIEERAPDAPFFYWFHYMDPHGPYERHPGFNPAGRPLIDMNATERLRARYDSEIAYADHHIGRLLEALPKENTFVVFAADHGESLNEHGYIGHSRRVHQTTMQIPLIIRGPGIPPGRSVLPVRGIDVGTTLLGLAGLEPAEGMLGKDLLRDEIDPGRVRVIETFSGGIPIGAEACYELIARDPSWQAVIEGGWKLIRSTRRTWLYEISHDPGEKRNLRKENPDRAAAMEKHITRWNAELPRNHPGAPELTKEDLRALEAVGYL